MIKKCILTVSKMCITSNSKPTAIDNNFQLSIISGYGWTSYNYHEVQIGPNFSNHNEYDIQSKGFPVEIECKYQHFLTADSVFEPTIGIGIGYCNFKSTIKNGNSSPNENGYM